MLSKSLSVIPLEFVGARFAPKQPWAYSVFPPVQPGTDPQEKGVLTWGNMQLQPLQSSEPRDGSSTLLRALTDGERSK